MLQINQRIELEVNSGEYAGTYLSRVEEIGENDVKIAIPVEKGSIIPLRLKTPVTITLLAKDAVYSGNSFIIGRLLEPIPVLVLLKPKEYRRIQRRDYVRIDVKLPVKVEISLGNNQEETAVINTHTSNISGGGMMLVIQKSELNGVDIPLDSTIELTFEIPEENYTVQAIAQVVRSTKEVSAKNEEELIVGARFTLIEEKAREEIISYVFKRQRELRKLGLI